MKQIDKRIDERGGFIMDRIKLLDSKYVIHQTEGGAHFKNVSKSSFLDVSDGRNCEVM